LGVWDFLGFGAEGLEGRVGVEVVVSSSSFVSARRRKLRDFAVDMVVVVVEGECDPFWWRVGFLLLLVFSFVEREFLFLFFNKSVTVLVILLFILKIDQKKNYSF
jgi:hypothetical protein